MCIDLTEVRAVRNPSYTINHFKLDVETLNGDVFQVSVPINSNAITYSCITLHTLYLFVAGANARSNPVANHELLIEDLTSLQLELKAEVYQMKSGTKE